MKVTLLDPSHDGKLNRDFAAGLGTGFRIGNGLRAKILEFIRREGETLPTMSQGYLAAILKENGHEVDYASKLEGKPDLVLIQSSMMLHKKEIEAAKQAKASGAKVGVYGKFASAMPEIYSNAADFVVRGEPEGFALGLKTKKGIPKGVVESRQVKDLEKLPFPDWSVFPWKKYSYYPVMKEKPFLFTLSSRGCPYQCNYCAYIVDSSYRARSAKNAVDEVEQLKDNYGVNGLLFRDPIFTCGKKRGHEITLELKKRKIDLSWACETRLDHLDEGLLEGMASAGLKAVKVGIESVNEKVLHKFKRKTIEARHQEKMVEKCDKLGIKVVAFYIIGLPTDTKESILGTIDYAKNLNTYAAQFTVCTPFPGTEFYGQMKGKIFDHDFTHYDSFTPVFRHDSIEPREIEWLREKAFVDYYFRPAYLAKWFWKALTG